MMVMDTQTIQELIPNRYPIFYIDRVTDLVPDQSITAERYVSATDETLAPGTWQLPSTLIIETLAQAASILILKSPQFAGKTAYLASIGAADFLQPVTAGSIMELRVDMTKVRANMGIVATQALVDGQVAVTAELHFIVSPQVNA
ncbi:3-hydroxyacyl-ACP dehydratase FabZ family protein [Lacticaseibacillus saniviri]|uniref:3-hydroxymyristoyl 3-hydroxydecanoyl-(Acyl carrier protein) dehydratase n=1 Tax=Lacticaseibacillus saniviri JCM 17471 = DSM 24301 TaxID=1293598 RepID=A0A0R2MS93_9LACO|nr:3-hydroxyacyl-ACP dehydratase FabZ family protein [Lacticaseibacillus saniviri]KRO16438.1 3-hydroxymyristoyl 3-hydroxydecanoyl-(acyl carrier protein) dehydratase [Lacticaseibacillus saniviri JCM 17471 = DSM 24301]MCG4282548.1 beta-hydroxyacyl-ACP dehydratase [Lacticaseibacillus saniviri]